MNSRPILFSAAMVKAILAGRKTQTRRIVKPQPSPDFIPTIGDYQRPLVRKSTGELYPEKRIRFGASDENEDYPCPYGKPGDQLWVKETWSTARGLDHLRPTSLRRGAPIEYVADGWREGFGLRDKGKTRVSLFMRRWMSRITLEVTGVRMERLQSITEADAAAEGTPAIQTQGELQSDGTLKPLTLSARFLYEGLWDRINGPGPGSWSANPWAWVVTFREGKRDELGKLWRHDCVGRE